RRTDLDVLGRLDCLRSKASLARLLKASDPLVNTEGRIRIKQARHPLLVLSRLKTPLIHTLSPEAGAKDSLLPSPGLPVARGTSCSSIATGRQQRAMGEAQGEEESVVPNDLELCDPVRVLIISGPNTGGKTVTLKIAGLFALMVRS